MAEKRPAADHYDAVVVGAGAAGSVFAATLSEAGWSVLVLDAGPAWSLGDLTSSQIWARRLRWGGAVPQSVGAHPFAHVFNAGWGLGGAALHHYGVWPRLHEEDFRMKSLYGKGFDWPIDYEGLRSFYDKVQQDVGLAGDGKQEIWRPRAAPYPMKPVKTFAQGRIIAKGFAKLDMHVAPVPMAITTEWYNDRPPCLYDGWCDAGCPIGSLANPLVTYLPRAEAAGAEIRARATVLRVTTNHKGQATGVIYADRQGQQHEVRADNVVLAASVIQNPAILLNSTDQNHPQGLANNSGQVGKYFMTHSVASVFGLFDQDTEVHKGLSGAQLTCRDGYKKDDREGMFGSYQWLIGPAMKPNDLLGVATTRADLFGPALDAFMHDAVRHMANMVAMGEELPSAENRIELTGKHDANGNRLPRIVHGFDQDAIAVWQHAKDEGLRVFEAAGARSAWNGPLASAHMMGGTIMGADPATSVTDSYGRCHDMPNLLLAGGGLFPTSGGVNPTFTIHALALRAAQHLIG